MHFVVCGLFLLGGTIWGFQDYHGVQVASYCFAAGVPILSYFGAHRA